MVKVLVPRHSLVVRITHWINVLSLLLMLLSGLQIFNAHPALYFGQQSDFAHPWLSMRAYPAPGGLEGVTRIGSAAFETTGFLGASDFRGHPQARGFPAWLTLPPFRSLALGRRWHFFFAWVFVLNGLAYLLYAFASGRVRGVLWPTGTAVRGIGASLRDHLRLNFPRGEAARRYNVLQQLSYLLVLFGLLPLMLLTGLTMSPAVDARVPALLDLFGGRQSARTLHFFTASALVLFFVIHLLAVLAAGPLNEMRSIVTGWFVIRTERVGK